MDTFYVVLKALEKLQLQILSLRKLSSLFQMLLILIVIIPINVISKTHFQEKWKKENREL